MKESKPFKISKHVVLTAFKRVKANRGSEGIDGQDIKEFEKNLKRNLYKVWNRMSSGSYFPPPVKLVEIPKKTGGKRGLGIPTVEDRVAQMVVKMYLEPKVEPIFHEDSYGYRPNKSAIDAIGQARKRCWKYDYVIEFDIKGLFDNIDHELLMRAVQKHTKESWIRMYVERWLKAPFIDSENRKIERKSGTPQGGVISPVLANLFMHYAFDVWMLRTNPRAPFERYADDAIIHCKSEEEAQDILRKLNQRLKECKLELHPEKTKIVYCKDKDRVNEYPVIEFDFLGYTFRRIFIKDRLGRLQFNFLPSVSKKSGKSFRSKIKAMNIHKFTGCNIQIIAEMINPMIRGWLNYFTKYNPSAVKYSIDCVNRRLTKWAMCKYKRFRGHRKRAETWLKALAKREPSMFPHWVKGMTP
ncbi:group II intron reverse transcriptase/maturase [Neobacillus mesonae]|uniref:RNA-directed DNA polymerase n=1 Tax=Neobacillus mesonae TaxID=1193713 RepID=A0A3Q9QVW5_9BACI|nr:group II intron reverse transcriptase/maturase [Neobacillus mesonae]AZU60839.1 group II intron reverse transcriptase/maturase [Neobacillus mesonae]AZU62953.1 group II intron reverse transcriptase/maturase [Neobacillus mesonae]